MIDNAFITANKLSELTGLHHVTITNILEGNPKVRERSRRKFRQGLKTAIAELEILLADLKHYEKNY